MLKVQLGWANGLLSVPFYYIFFSKFPIGHLAFRCEYEDDHLWFSLQLNLIAGEEVQIEYEVDGWFYVSIHKAEAFLFFPLPLGFQRELHYCDLSQSKYR